MVPLEERVVHQTNVAFTDTLEDLTVSREQAEQGDTVSLDELADKYGVDVDVAEARMTDVEYTE